MGVDMYVALDKLSSVGIDVSGSAEQGYYLGDNTEVSFSKEQVIVLAEQLFNM